MIVCKREKKLEKNNWNKNIIVVSGGFDPVHKGHMRMFREAANLGAIVIVGLNSDEWLTRKKGKPFMEFEERKEILEGMKYINQVIPFDDSDDTACDLIRKVHKIYESDDYEQIAYSGGGSELSDFEGIIGDFIRNGGRIEELFTYAVKEK